MLSCNYSKINMGHLSTRDVTRGVGSPPEGRMGIFPFVEGGMTWLLL